MWVDRFLNLQGLLDKNSYFLFGPRAVGKSNLIRRSFSDEVQYINLLDSEIYLRLASTPSDLKHMIDKKKVIIDEIQRVPELLNMVHLLIEEKKIKFLLTGSSARKLKRKGVNLLSGRAYKSSLFGLTWYELREQFELNKYLQYGGLPLSYLSDEPNEFLYNYVDTYLKEEIQAEALVQNLPNYHRFLIAAAHANGNLLNFSKIGNNAQLSPNTVRDYYQILEDTLIGFQLPAWTRSKKRQALSRAKFYFFDPGVTRVIRGIKNIDPQSDLYGHAFEQFIACEIRAYLNYNFIREDLCYWQSKSQYEVDFIVGENLAVEVKATKKVTKDDHKGLRAINEEKDWNNLILVSQDRIESRNEESGIQNMYWETFLNKLWAGTFI